MQELKSVFLFETKTKAKNKAYIISVIVAVLIVFAITFLPTIIEAIEGDSSDSSDGEFGFHGDLVLYIDGHVNDELESVLGASFNVEKASSAEEVEKKVNEDSDKIGLVLESPMKGELIKKDVSISSMYIPVDQILEANYKYNIALPEAGIDTQKVAEIDRTRPSLKVKNLGKSVMGAIGFAYVALFFLYFLILMLGSTISTSVVREKESRMMEILITNVSPRSLIVGKVLSGVFLGLLETVCILISMAAGFFVNFRVLDHDNKMLRMVLESISWDMIVVFIIVTILGTTMYYFMFAALGALVSRMEDLQSAIAPATILVIAAFVFPMFSITEPNSIIMKVTSFVPFTSPLALVARYSMATVPLWQLLISLAILLVTAIIVAAIATKIYRMGSLNYGNRVGFFKALKKLSKKA